MDPMNFVGWLLIAVMIFFLMFGTRAPEQEDLKANIRRRNSDEGDGDRGDDVQ